MPISTQFDDPYYSLEDGLAETKHVFLDGNGLPDQFSDRFHIAELGLGTGLNLIMALHAWRQSGKDGKLNFTSFEAFPLTASEMKKALSPFVMLTTLIDELAPHFGKHEFEIRDLKFTMIEGDARATLPNWQDKANAWFLDGFSPAKNPELWEESLMEQVGRHTHPTGTFATYTAAGHVRRSLTKAGFSVQRVSGFGRKRHMTIGKLK